MKAYIDTSVLLRITLGEPGRLAEWTSIDLALTSELTRVESMRAIDRARIELHLADAEIAERRAFVLDVLQGFHVARVDRVVLDRAADPFPTLIRTLDAIHLATATLVRGEYPDIVFATHDEAQAMAARALGFQVVGVKRAARAR